MPEPAQLKRGKDFQRIVQDDYSLNSKGGHLTIEQHVSFCGMEKVKQLRGRMDIFISEEGDDFVTIIEIKATDWDKIKEKNIKRNLYRHSKQLYRYIDKFVDINNMDVCLAVIYPKPPIKKGLRELVETCAMDNYCFPVYWYSEINT